MTRVAVVTGAAGGIGTATCEVLESDGWSVLGVDVCRPLIGEWMDIDVADGPSLDRALRALPRVDALVNNAATQLDSSIQDTAPDQWDLVLRTNLNSAFVAIRAVQSQLTAADGSIVNVASVHGHASSRLSAAYASTKGGLLALTRAAAVELGPLGIRVNAVSPGAIDTPALRRGSEDRDDAFLEDLAKKTPLRRVGLPRDIAEAIGFLVDPRRSSFITGQSLVVDGGALAKLSTE